MKVGGRVGFFRAFGALGLLDPASGAVLGRERWFRLESGEPPLSNLLIFASLVDVKWYLVVV